MVLVINVQKLTFQNNQLVSVLNIHPLHLDNCTAHLIHQIQGQGKKKQKGPKLEPEELEAKRG